MKFSCTMLMAALQLQATKSGQCVKNLLRNHLMSIIYWFPFDPLTGSISSKPDRVLQKFPLRSVIVLFNFE